MAYFQHDRRRLFYTDRGSGATTLILLHGLGSDSNDWSWIEPRLVQRYRVVALDLPGHGHSDGDCSYELADTARSVVDLAEHIGCSPFVPVGHSLGGAVAACLAVDFGEAIRAVVELDPAYGLPAVVVDAWEQNRAAAGFTRAALPESMLQWPTISAFFANWLARRVESMDPGAFWGHYEGLARGPQKMFRSSPQADDYLRRRTCPVLSIHSMPGRADWERGLFRNPRSSALEWVGSSHYLHIERYAEFAIVLEGWLDSLES